MSDRERRLRELLDQRAKEFRARATMPARLLRRARTSMAVTALAVCLVASGLGYGAFAGVRALRGQAVPAVRNPTPSHQSLPPPPTSLSTPSPSPISVPGTQLVLPLSGPVDQLSVGDGALYAAYSPTGGLDHEGIVRLDLWTHAVVHSAPRLAGIAMAVADGVGPQVVWVTHWDESNPGSRILSGLDSRTLADVIPGVGVPGIPEVGGPGSPSELVAT